jgi:penicillin-binding protein 1C
LKIINALKSKNGILFLFAIALFVWFWFSLPSPLFKTATSTVLEDKSGKLLAARIAEDGQWRFPSNKNASLKFITCLIQFEDRSYFEHKGVDPFAFVRALIQNIKAKRVVSGGSTLSMQVIRLSRKGQSRTFFEKFIEISLATRLELSYSKFEILALYSSNAPFGSNVVGLDAASWRYFGREPSKLSWAESATLAVLPNAPSLIYPGKNQERLLKKRNRLLDRLVMEGIIDKETCELSKQEPLPQKPHAIPQLAPHLLQRAAKEGFKGQRVLSTIDGALQERLNDIIENHHKTLRSNEIHNAAAIVLEVSTGNVLAYVGNTQNEKSSYENDVDCINAPRSTGSILKPFLFASMLNDGELLPTTLIPDIPTQIAGYAPQNYNMTFDGAVPAKRALARSLNIPAVRMLQSYGIEKFNYKLKKLGMTTLRFSPDHYGLSVILGGAEGKLWDITGMYASMARTLNNYTKYNGNYVASDFHAPNYEFKKTQTESDVEKNSVLDAASIFLTFEAMVEVSRPDEEAGWRQFNSAGKIAWKTGTSFGFRDGWAIGVTATHVVGVWVGNADGEGRPGLTGIQTAAPIMFDIFSVLKANKWFNRPYDEMEQVAICHQSGSRATDICEPVDTLWIQKNGLRTEPCKYHRLVHLDESGQYRVNSDCEDVSKMKHVSWFVLPPAIEWYYKSNNTSYKELPPMRSDCETQSLSAMEIIYPKQFSKIYVPVELDGKMGKTIFQVAHRKASKLIYWHLDGVFMGTTQNNHQLDLSPDEGIHVLTLVDEEGESLIQKFEIVSKKK